MRTTLSCLTITLFVKPPDVYVRPRETIGGREERIEGIVIEETRDMRGAHRIVIEQRDPDMADPLGYARATVILHAPLEPKSDE